MDDQMNGTATTNKIPLEIDNISQGLSARKAWRIQVPDLFCGLVWLREESHGHVPGVVNQSKFAEAFALLALRMFHYLLCIAKLLLLAQHMTR